MTAPILPDPKYHAWVNQNIQKLRKAGFTDQEIRNDWLMGEQGMADTTASKFIPPPAPPPVPGAAPDALTSAMNLLGAAMPGMPKRPQMGDVENVANMGLAGVRGATLGASDLLTDQIPAVKQSAEEFRANNPLMNAGMELTGGMVVNPFKWLAKAPGVVGKVGRFMAPGASEVKSGLKEGLKKIGGATARGAAYGGTYGAFTGEGGLGDRALSAGASAFGGAVLGAGIGTAFAIPEHIAATKAMRAATGLSPKSRDIISEAQKVQGGLRDPSTMMPGELLIDNAGPLEQSLVHEALRRSDEGLVLANKVKSEWIAAQKDAPTGFALEIAGVDKRMPNPKILATTLRNEAKQAAAPLYARLNAENPVIPLTPELSAAMESPTFQGFLTSPAFRRFSADRAAGDKVRNLMGKAARGEIMSPEAIQGAMRGQDPKIADLMARMADKEGKVPPKVAEAIMALGGGEAPTFDWRTLNAAKMAIDQSLRGEPVGGLAKMARAELQTVREALVTTMKAAAPGYEEALNTYAGGHVMAEMLEAGQLAAAKGVIEAEALLADPKVLAHGKSAVDQVRYGILQGLHDQLNRASRSAQASGEVWTGDRIGLLKLVAQSPEQAASVDAFVNAQAKRFAAFGVVPPRVPRIQTGGQEAAEAALAGGGVAGLTGTGLGFRMGNAVQRILGKMSPKEAFEVAQTYFSGDPVRAMSAVMRPFSRDASRVGQAAGLTAGIGISNALNP